VGGPVRAGLQVAVDRRAGDAKLVGDLLDGVGPVSVGPISSYMSWAILARRAVSLGRWPPVRPRARAASRPSRVRSHIEACSNSAIAPRIWKNIWPDSGRGVDALVQYDQVDLAGLEVFGQGD
jgi:hypothetical protein